jgi:lipoprotein-anchoring transpeptidase ErfK/SrfK
VTAEIFIHLDCQQLELRDSPRSLRSFPVSTARNGPGETTGSECTPRGRHRIRAKIGAGLPIRSVFVGRRPTGECYTPQLHEQFPDRDWILTRILWLSGLEPGRNRFGAVDTARRYIYIHGSPDDLVTGFPDSHGCIRMKNADILELFERVDCGTLVIIR